MLINRDNLKFRVGIFLFIYGSFIFAQETHNLEIIWQKASPESVFYFGRCIASGDVNGDSFSDIMIVGDTAIDAGPVIDTFQGKCWIFYGGHNFDTIPDVCLNNLQKLTFWSLHSADINGDGFDDVILGACNNGPSGQVLIFLGGNPVDTICDFKVRGPSLSSVFGCSVSSGDVNGDSFSDLIVGAYGFDNLKGRVYIYFGGMDFDTIPDVILNGGHNNDPEAFGRTVSGSGDVNGDGFSDIIIGAMNFDHDRGRIYIYFGGNPMDTIYDVAMTGDEPDVSIGEFGVDFIKNLLTFDHVITSSPLWGPINPQGYNPGKVYVLFGGSPMDSIPDVWMIGSTDASWLGMSISTAGDLTNDIYPGLISGAPTEYDHKGTAYIWLGDSVLDTIPDAWIRGEIVGDRIGFYVASAGDVNDDSKDEIMVSNYAGSTPKRVWVCRYTGPGIEERETQNARPLLLEVNPNPSRTHAAISFTLNARSKVYVKIYDITGKIIRVLDDGQMLDSGENEIKWDLRDDNKKRVATGIYFIEINAGKELKEIRKITVVK